MKERKKVDVIKSKEKRMRKKERKKKERKKESGCNKE